MRAAGPDGSYLVDGEARLPGRDPQVDPPDEQDAHHEALDHLPSEHGRVDRQRSEVQEKGVRSESRKATGVECSPNTGAGGSFVHQSGLLCVEKKQRGKTFVGKTSNVPTQQHLQKNRLSSSPIIQRYNKNAES